MQGGNVIFPTCMSFKEKKERMEVPISHKCRTNHWLTPRGIIFASLEMSKGRTGITHSCCSGRPDSPLSHTAPLHIALIDGVSRVNNALHSSRTEAHKGNLPRKVIDARAEHRGFFLWPVGLCGSTTFTESQASLLPVRKQWNHICHWSWAITGIPYATLSNYRELYKIPGRPSS